MKKEYVLDNILNVWHSLIHLRNDAETYNDNLHYSVNIDMLYNAVKEIVGFEVEGNFNEKIKSHIEELLLGDKQEDELSYPKTIFFLFNTNITERT
jgi:hypothetical protein